MNGMNGMENQELREGKKLKKREEGKAERVGEHIEASPAIKLIGRVSRRKEK